MTDKRLGASGDGERTDQQRSADSLAASLKATAGELAKARRRTPSTAVEPEMVALVSLLHKLAVRLTDACPRAMQGQVDDEEWAVLSAALASAATACREQHHPVILEGED